MAFLSIGLIIAEFAYECSMYQNKILYTKEVRIENNFSDLFKYTAVRLLLRR